ncbi:Hsp33 family molecular chaperone HslO [Salinispirillum sp. LH 10-3-1]|uniref:33 kDa chaperonin n=1 Tax=Salinispirillum sp. LH 10-3-1 TaxID=2952525 RepID=A0AB38YGR0_9GAMM
MSNPDQRQRLLFDDLAIRGELVGLEQTYQDVLKQHPYPKPLQQLLGEFMAAVTLLSNTLKFEGILSLQARGAGQARLVMAEIQNQEQLRAIAQYNDDFVDSGAMLGEGTLAITIDPKVGKRYQGIVSLRDHGLAAALEDYFLQSEQIRTRIWLAADGKRASGMLLQALPGSASQSSLEADADGWDRVTQLAATITDAELLELDNESMLYRLFHEEVVRTYPPTDVWFQCTCSRERSANAVYSLGIESAREVIAQDGVVQVDCQFCHAKYNFNQDDVEQLFADANKHLN